jgi:plastocyanin
MHFRYVLGTVVVALACTDAGAQAQSLRVLVENAQGQPLEDAVVIAAPAAGIKSLPKPREEIVDQIDREFVPYVKPILVGSTVRFPNKDNIRHHVYSFSAAKSFELPLYAGTPAAPILFDKPGVVILGCNIHDWMVGYIYVSESPYFAKTGADGAALLNELPKGQYRVRVWHPDLQTPEEATARLVEVDEQNQAPQHWQLTTKPAMRVQRAPVPGADHYH